VPLYEKTLTERRYVKIDTDLGTKASALAYLMNPELQSQEEGVINVNDTAKGKKANLGYGFSDDAFEAVIKTINLNAIKTAEDMCGFGLGLDYVKVKWSLLPQTEQCVGSKAAYETLKKIKPKPKVVDCAALPNP